MESNLVCFLVFRPCFNEGERLMGLQRGDASFVDIIHTNVGILGIKEARGDVDFFPNGYALSKRIHLSTLNISIIHEFQSTNNNLLNKTFSPSWYRQYALQPGCWSIICAHSRSYEYFAETVHQNNGNNFIGTQCNSLSALRGGKCAAKRIPMGIDTPHTARGNYYLETNKKSPYGRSFQKYANIQQLAQLIQKLDQIDVQQWIAVALL